MKVYIAGSISNNTLYKQQFNNKAKELEEQGHTVINPVKPLGFDYKDYIDMGLSELSKCDVIYMLNGWNKSRGARLEYHYAKTVGIKIVYESDIL